MQIWAESGKSALPICNYSQILYQFLTFTQNLKRSLFDSRIIINSTAKFYISISYQKDLLSIDTRIFTPSDCTIFFLFEVHVANWVG